MIHGLIESEVEVFGVAVQIVKDSCCCSAIETAYMKEATIAETDQDNILNNLSQSGFRLV